MAQRMQFYQDKMVKLQEKINAVRSNFYSSVQIGVEIDNLTKFFKKFKIYIVFMGTISSGKSTLINALLGQQLLPSSYQICTSQVTYIGHQNTNANQETFITINGQQFDSTVEASKSLTSIRTDGNVKIVEIKTQSYFHRTLEEDFQDRIFLIDTPGIKLENCKSEEYLQQIDKINKQIKQDEKSVRIYVYVNDYTTFDRDRDFFKDIISQIRSKGEWNQQQFNQNQVNNQVRQSNDESQQFFIINKFDQRIESEDDPIEIIKQDIIEVFQTQNIYMISASKALGYNIMNYGTEKDRSNFIEQYYKDNQASLDDLDEAKYYCKRRIKGNRNLMKRQDFDKFIFEISTEISTEIQKVNDELFYDKISQLFKQIHISLKRELIKNAKQSLTKLQRNSIDKLLKIFPQNQEFQEQQLQKLKNNVFNSISDLITLAQQEIQKLDPKIVIEKTCQMTFVQFHKLNQQLLHRVSKSNVKLLDLLKFEMKDCIKQEKILNSILKFCEYNFEQFMEDHICEYQKQSSSKYATELYSNMGIYVKSHNLSLNLEFNSFEQDLPTLNSNLIKWKLSLEQQIKDLISKYMKIHAEIQMVISQFIQEIIN